MDIVDGTSRRVDKTRNFANGMATTISEPQNLASLSRGPFVCLDWPHTLIKRLTGRIGFKLKKGGSGCLYGVGWTR